MARVARPTRTPSRRSVRPRRPRLYTHGNGGGAVELKPVSRGAVNSRWASATPSGELKMYVSNPSAFEWFKNRIGKECSISIDEYTPDPTDHAFVKAKEITESTFGYDCCEECGYREELHS